MYVTDGYTSLPYPNDARQCAIEGSPVQAKSRRLPDRLDSLLNRLQSAHASLCYIDNSCAGSPASCDGPSPKEACAKSLGLEEQMDRLESIAEGIYTRVFVLEQLLTRGR